MTQSIVGLFNSFTEANGAKQTLMQQGFSASDIKVSAHEGDMPLTSTTSQPSSGQTQSNEGFMAGVEHFFFIMKTPGIIPRQCAAAAQLWL
jgi:hypothetical protein